MFRDFVTSILLGSQWQESANIIGVTALSIALRTIFVRIYSEVYRAKGKFYLPLILQIIDLFIMIPACLISIQQGFWSLVYTMAWIRLCLIPLEFIFSWRICKISAFDTLKEIYPSAIATTAMTIVGFLLWDVYPKIWWTICAVIVCIVVYFGILFLFKREREAFLKPIVEKILKRRK